MLIPLILAIFSAGCLLYSYKTTGEFVRKGIEMKGGSIISIDKYVPATSLENEIERKFGIDVDVRNVRKAGGYAGTIIETKETNVRELVSYLSEKYDVTPNVRTIGPMLGKAFFKQTKFAICFAFLLMSFVVFVSFRVFIPCIAIILAAALDILFALAMMSILRIELSLATLGALLMLIGYSVDTDILLTSRILKANNVDEEIKATFKTGITMTLTTMSAFTTILLLSSSEVLKNLATVVIMGLIADIPNTWILNATLLRKYLKK